MRWGFAAEHSLLDCSASGNGKWNVRISRGAMIAWVRLRSAIAGFHVYLSLNLLDHITSTIKGIVHSMSNPLNPLSHFTVIPNIARGIFRLLRLELSNRG